MPKYSVRIFVLAALAGPSSAANAVPSPSRALAGAPAIEFAASISDTRSNREERS